MRPGRTHTHLIHMPLASFWATRATCTLAHRMYVHVWQDVWIKSNRGHSHVLDACAPHPSLAPWPPSCSAFRSSHLSQGLHWQPHANHEPVSAHHALQRVPMPAWLLLPFLPEVASGNVPFEEWAHARYFLKIGALLLATPLSHVSVLMNGRLESTHIGASHDIRAHRQQTITQQADISFHWFSLPVFFVYVCPGYIHIDETHMCDELQMQHATEHLLICVSIILRYHFAHFWGVGT